MNIETPETIHKDIAKLLTGGLTYIEALVEYAERTNVDIELIGNIIKKSPIFYEKIKEEAIAKNIVKMDEEETLDKFFAE